MNKIGISIIGTGNIGHKRAKNLPKSLEIISCFDIDKKQREQFATDFNCIACSSIEEVLNNNDVAAVIISTLHDTLSEITIQSVIADKHVLVEKPAGLNSNQIQNIINHQKKSKKVVCVGFNHRYHPSIIKAREIISEGRLGEIMFIRGRYGHGGRVGYDREWRSFPEKGGGELLDQGPHLIDISRLILGDFIDTTGFVNTYFWDMSVDDNAFMILKTKEEKCAFLHVSCTEWKNMFSLEVYGKIGKLDIKGLGGSYGVEEITHYEMQPEMGPPPSHKWTFDEKDKSWSKELDDFVYNIQNENSECPTLYDALAVHKVIEDLKKNTKYDNY